MNMISKEAEALLFEILEHESDGEYWAKRFKEADNRTDTILRGCFRELDENELVKTSWADSIPVIIQVLKDGYLYQQHKEEQEKAERESNMETFEKELTELIDRGNFINSSTVQPYNTENELGNHPLADIWIDDAKDFCIKYLKTHPFSQELEYFIHNRKFQEILETLNRINNDKSFPKQMNAMEKAEILKYQAKALSEYDVFISHANKDKEGLIDELYKSLNQLGIKIFYDKESLEWGDNWKDRILNGTKKAEFAIIVISENFFDREWTERELSEFLNRQNRNGQKLILPIIHNITNEQLKSKYPNVADIQVIDSSDYNCDQIALLFARQLIKRLKTE